MRQSKLFGKTMREAPTGETAKNAMLLERAGFVYKTMSGVYDFLPLGLRVLDKINNIIREEMNRIGGQEVFMSALQPKARWDKTNRWTELASIMYQFSTDSSQSGALGLAATHEEAISEIAARFVFSYRDLPLAVYQIQTKFRNEPRAKSGLIRGREFLMKDLYSFHVDDDDLDKFYEIADSAYRRIFQRCGLEVYVTEAPGGTFTKEYTHEYQVLSDAGEDRIMLCVNCKFAQNREISSFKTGDDCPKCGKSKIEEKKGIEVGNIFKLGTKFSQAFNLYYSDIDGRKLPVVMGCYGIGPGRVMGTIVEIHADSQGLAWPPSVSPFAAHLVALKTDASRQYALMLDCGLEVLYDDREDKTAGEKFADADLIGIPWRIVVSPKTSEKGAVEVKKRDAKEVKLMPVNEAIDFIKNYVW